MTITILLLEMESMFLKIKIRMIEINITKYTGLVEMKGIRNTVRVKKEKKKEK